MKERILATILCICALAGTVGMSSAAATLETLFPETEPGAYSVNNNVYTRLDMSINNRTLTCLGTVRGPIGTTRITGAFTLERLEANGRFTIIGRWSESVNAMQLYSIRALTGQEIIPGTYRLSVTAHVTVGSSTIISSDSITRSFYVLPSSGADSSL